MRNLSIEIKMILSVIFFTLLIVGLERYQMSKNIAEQFVESQRAKNKLLIDTVSPIIGLNIALGLDHSNKEYLDQIARQNPDLIRFELKTPQNTPLYRYTRSASQTPSGDAAGAVFYTQAIADPLTGETLAQANLHFDSREYQRVLEKNRETTLKMAAFTFALLAVFIFLIKREFKFLKKLAKNVLTYDPKQNNFPLTPSERTDEVGIVHNAILSMVTRIQSHAKLLDELNQSLERSVSERTRELREANERLKELSITDPLTGLYNRRHFQNHLQEIWELAKRNHATISIIMCDIDHFKEVNDHYGHMMGDQVLKEVGSVLKNSLKRATDFLARYGGEEFIIVLYDTDISAARELCTAVQNNLKAIDGFAYQEATIPPITLSFGIGSMVPNERNRFEHLIKMADCALYQAKEQGRNRIVLFAEDDR